MCVCVCVRACISNIYTYCRFSQTDVHVHVMQVCVCQVCGCVYTSMCTLVDVVCGGIGTVCECTIRM